MVAKGTARLFKRKDGKYLIYVPLDFAQDTMFPFKGDNMKLEITFTTDSLILKKLKT